MDRLTSPKTIKGIMDRYGFKFSKKYGQNFIIDENVLDRIVKGAAIDKEDAVLEIGPGIGVMTDALCKSANKVVSIEIDQSLLPVLAETVGHHENLTIIQGDVLKVDLMEIFRVHFENTRPKLVANLPYYVTTPIIMKFLEERIPVSDLVIMIQKEVADRIMAHPSTSDYGALSVAVQYFTEPSIVTRVSRGSFMPMPNVDSTVLRLKNNLLAISWLVFSSRINFNISFSRFVRLKSGFSRPGRFFFICSTSKINSAIAGSIHIAPCTTVSIIFASCSILMSFTQ